MFSGLHILGEISGKMSEIKMNFFSRTSLGSNVCGILWMLLAGLLFSCMVALIKLLGSRIPSYEIVFFRSSIQLVVLSFVFWRIGFSSLKTTRPLLQGLRALTAVLLINCNFYAFTKLPLADVTSIGFSRNLFLILLAVPLLGEKVSMHRILAAIVGFIGIVIIIRPGQSAFEGAALIALAGAGLGATMMIMIRKLTATDSNVAMMAYPSMAIVSVMAIPTYLMWIAPTNHEILLLILMSFMGISGQWCMIKAFRNGEATAVAPASYLRLIFATIIGYYFFAEIPDTLTVVGTIIIVGSNLHLVFKEKAVHKTATGSRVPGDVT